MATGVLMADPVHNALRRKLAAAEAVGDVARIKIIRGLMAKPVEEPAEAPIEAPLPVPAPYIVRAVATPPSVFTWTEGDQLDESDE